MFLISQSFFIVLFFLKSKNCKINCQLLKNLLGHTKRQKQNVQQAVLLISWKLLVVKGKEIIKICFFGSEKMYN
jgi:hypothetical protein